MIDPNWRKIAETLNELSEQYGAGKVELELRRIFAPLLACVPASVLVQAGLSESEAVAGSRSGDSQQTVQGETPAPPHPPKGEDLMLGNFKIGEIYPSSTTNTPIKWDTEPPRRPNLDIWNKDEKLLKCNEEMAEVIQQLYDRTIDLKNRLEDLEAKFQ